MAWTSVLLAGRVLNIRDNHGDLDVEVAQSFSFASSMTSDLRRFGSWRGLAFHARSL